MKWNEVPKKKRTYIIVAAGILGILLWAFVTAKVLTHDFNRLSVTGKQDEQQAVIKGVILTETKNESKYWELYGENGKWDSRNGVAQLDKVLANFYKDNEVSMSLESSKGTYNSKTKEVILYKDTFIVLKDGITLNADKLTYINSKTPIVAQGHIKVRKAGVLLSEADKITISPEFDKFKIEGNTVSKVYEDKK
jgi:LPS export ABC transporter protein LptC